MPFTEGELENIHREAQDLLKELGWEFDKLTKEELEVFNRSFTGRRSLYLSRDGLNACPMD